MSDKLQANALKIFNRYSNGDGVDEHLSGEYTRQELLHCWNWIHDAVKKLGYRAELDHPKLFKRYNEMCKQFGEEAEEIGKVSL